MPFRSVVLYCWADHVDDEHVVQLGEALDQLAALVPGVRNLTHGRDTGVVGGSSDYVIVVDLDDVGGWRALRDHPSFILLVEEFVTNHVVEQSVGQYRIADPSTMSADDADVRGLSDGELLERARRAARAEMDALLAEPDDTL